MPEEQVMSTTEKNMRKFIDKHHGGEVTTDARRDLASYFIGVCGAILKPDDDLIKRTDSRRVKELREALEAFKNITKLT